MIGRLGWAVCNWEIWKQLPECDGTGRWKGQLLCQYRGPATTIAGKCLSHNLALRCHYITSLLATRPQPWHVPVNRCHMLLLNAHEAREQTPGPLLELPQKSQIPLTCICQQTQKQLKYGFHLSMFTSASKPHTLHSPFKKLARPHTKPGKAVWEIQTYQSLACSRLRYKGVGRELREKICIIGYIIFLILQIFNSLT